MRIVCSPSGILYSRQPGQGAMDLAGAGFFHLVLEMDWCCSGWELENFGKEPDDGWPDEDKNEGREEDKKEDKEEKWVSVLEDKAEIGRRFGKMEEVCRAKGLDFPIARAPRLLRETKRRDLGETLLWLNRECIRYCSQAGCEAIVIPPLFSGLEYGKGWEKNREYYLALALAARENGVMILLENQCRSMNGHLIRGMCADAHSAAEWIDALNKEAKEPLFGFCMDVGICNLCGQDMYEFATALGHRLKAVILRDCDGCRESSMLPFTSVYQFQPQTDWLSLIRGLRSIGFDGDLVLDIRDTAAVFSPLLRPGLLALAKSVAEYVKWQVEIENALKKYSSIVLFGAGNMCRNFMKCYGEKYPPLFTCDNNQAKWGSRFCGLEVKSPQALKALPDGCGVFICNIYYREIERQLREMGVDRIEFFNDEYMPSFYFDRLKGV